MASLAQRIADLMEQKRTAETGLAAARAVERAALDRLREEFDVPGVAEARELVDEMVVEAIAIEQEIQAGLKELEAEVAKLEGIVR